jgi:hypothetical protein
MIPSSLRRFLADRSAVWKASKKNSRVPAQELLQLPLLSGSPSCLLRTAGLARRRS